MKTLITPNIVIESAPVDSKVNANLVSPHITKVEYRFLADKDTGCLGSDFYKALLADVREYEQFDATETFDAGDNVVYNGKIWEAQVNTSQVPGTGSDWNEVPLFNTASYQTLWEDYLCEMLAFAVIHSSVYKMSFRITTQGVVQNEGGDFKAASSDSIKLLKDELLADVQTLFKRMDEFLKDNKETYPLYKGNLCEDSSCGKKNPLGVYTTNKIDTDYFYD